MRNQELSFESFLRDVHPATMPYVQEIHDLMEQSGCGLKLEMAKSGYVVSYTFGKPKRTVMNFVFRKGGLMARIYGDHYGNYLDVLGAMPDAMWNELKESPDCKRMLDPTKCNSRCKMGYAVDLRGEELKKCRYSGLFFPVNEENQPSILAMLRREMEERAAS